MLAFFYCLENMLACTVGGSQTSIWWKPQFLQLHSSGFSVGKHLASVLILSMLTSVNLWKPGLLLHMITCHRSPENNQSRATHPEELRVLTEDGCKRTEAPPPTRSSSAADVLQRWQIYLLSFLLLFAPPRRLLCPDLPASCCEIPEAPGRPCSFFPSGPASTGKTPDFCQIPPWVLPPSMPPSEIPACLPCTLLACTRHVQVETRFG